MIVNLQIRHGFSRIHTDQDLSNRSIRKIRADPWPGVHKSAPYKISPVHIGFARKLLAGGAWMPGCPVYKPLCMSELWPGAAISPVGIHRALVQCERGKMPSGMGGKQSFEF